ncbi:STA13 [Fasciola hepatica]|uniref:STA13 n=1 Tax=Fasciola hepatica TaxID=6192 RepID=A0A4E0RJP4_FASHE|nr:STA13 [Fasciola hepatica]
MKTQTTEIIRPERTFLWPHFPRFGQKALSFSHPFPPDTSDGLDQLVNQPQKTCSSRNKWSADSTQEFEFHKVPRQHKANLLSEAADVIISKHQQQQREFNTHNTGPLAPLAQLEHDLELTLPRTHKSEEREATVNVMHRASVETDSSMSERYGAPVTSKHSQPVSPGREKPKILDSRRTTPRQLKQHQHKQSAADTKVSNSLTNVSDKNKSVTAPESTIKSNPSEIASSLIRTASLHLRSTWSKLKRSNSGHSAKSQSNSSSSLRERRCSDPSSRGLSFEGGDISPNKQPNHQPQHQQQQQREKQKHEHPAYEDELGKAYTVSVPPRVSSLKGQPKKATLNSTVPSISPQSRHRVASAPDESPPPPPGCSKWSTRLDPPPPVSNGRPVAHAHGPVVFKHIQRNRSTDLAPWDSDSSKHVGQVTSHMDWKPSMHGLGTTTFSSLPTRDSDDLNVFADDCVDVGELGRINFRTGSFMGRYPYSRGGGQSIRYPQLSTSGGPVTTHAQHRHMQQASATPSRLSPSRPLYLSPPYPAQSSGNTTRSAPSPSLSSMTSNSGPSCPEPILHKGKQLSGSKSGKTQTVPESASETAPVSTTLTSHAIEHGSTNPSSFLELDPVLARLLSDVSSLDEYRSALRPQAVQNRTCSLKPLRTSPTSPSSSEAEGNQLHVNSAALCSSPLGSSDPGSMAFSQEFYSQAAFSPAKQTSEDHYNLRQEINDLIQLEFSYRNQRGSPSRTGTVSRGHTTGTEDRATTPRLSEPNVTADLSKIGGFGPRSRHHPFRWSSGAHTSTPKSIQKPDDIRASPACSQPKILVHSPVSTSTLALEARSVDRMTGVGKRARIRPDPATDSQLNGGSFWGGDTDTGDQISLWFLTATQLALLRKLSLVQLTSLAEKHCVNRSPFNWRFLKYRAGTSPVDGASAISPPQTSQPHVDVQITQSVNRSARGDTTIQVNPIDPLQTSSSCAVTSQSTMSSGELNTSSHTPRWTGYDGPVFGQSLASWQRRLGYPLPSAIVHMMDHLERIGTTAHGIFRRPGGKVRTQALREQIEHDLSWKNFDDWQPYDVADLLKQFFRELPESLLTSKLSTVLVNVYSCIPASGQLDLLRWVLIGLPDENRVVLQKLLYLLNSLVRHAHVTQMSASNLAVCFAPSLFRLISAGYASQVNVGLSPRRLRRTTSGPDPKDLADQRTAQLSLSSMITHAPVLFEISTTVLRRARLIPNPFEPRDLESIIPGGDWPTWIQSEIGRVSRECSNTRSKGWSMLNRDAWKTYQSGSGAGESLEGLEIHYKKLTNPNDTKTGPPLRIWRCSLGVPESDPKEIIDRFWYHRMSWDPEVSHIQVVDQISDCVDVCVITYATIFPQPPCEVYALRGRQCMLEDGAALLLCESISQASVTASTMPSSFTASLSSPSVRASNAIGHVYQEHVYVRPVAEKTGCRVVLLSRVDLKGHSPDWYVNHWGHTLVRRLLNLRRSFQT